MEKSVMAKRKSPRAVQNAIRSLVGTTFIGGAIGAAARGTKRGAAQPRPFVPPKRGRKGKA
jgi:hypothetical protein